MEFNDPEDQYQEKLKALEVKIRQDKAKTEVEVESQLNICRVALEEIDRLRRERRFVDQSGPIINKLVIDPEDKFDRKFYSSEK